MGFVVSSLTDYVDQSSTELLVPTLYKAKTAGLAMKQMGIKSSAALQLLDNTLYLQDGSACGFTATGSTTFTQRNLSVAAITVNQQWCLKDLEAKWTQLLLSPSASYTEADMPQAIMNHIMGILAQTLEKQDWQGDTTSGNPNLNKYNGIQKIVSDAGTGINANVSAYTDGATLSSWTSSTVIKGVDALVAAATANFPGIFEKPGRINIFVDRSIFNLYIRANRNANYFGYNGTDGQDMNELRVLGYANVYLVATDGLNGTNDAYLIHESNLYMGADGEADADTTKVWYSNDDDVVKMRINFKRGWQIAYPSEVAYILL